MRVNLVIVGTGAIADVIADYFERESEYNVLGFATDREFVGDGIFRGKPVVAFDEVEFIYPPNNCKMFIAIGYTQLNHLKARFYKQAKEKGYELITYVSQHAYIHHNVKLGDNCFIFEDNVIQYDVKIGNNVMLWSGNHIGHGTVLRDHVYVASHVVISGFCDIGEYTFIGVNATFADKIKVGSNCLIGMGAIVSRDIEDMTACVPAQSTTFEITKLKGKNREMFCPPGV